MSRTEMLQAYYQLQQIAGDLHNDGGCIGLESRLRECAGDLADYAQLDDEEIRTGKLQGVQ